MNTKVADKFPCATCKDLPNCELALEVAGRGMFFEENGFPVTEVCLTCPQDGVTYKAKRKSRRVGE